MKENDVCGLRGLVTETLVQLGPRDDVNFDLTINKNSRSISIDLTIYAKDKYYETLPEAPSNNLEDKNASDFDGLIIE